jgi:hypothetical protein
MSWPHGFVSSGTEPLVWTHCVFCVYVRSGLPSSFGSGKSPGSGGGVAMPSPGAGDDGGDDDGCAAAGTAGANASEVAASTDRTRFARVTAIRDSTVGSAPGQPRPTGLKH